MFLLWASRQPAAHLSLIWFTVWSSVVHGGIMAVQAIVDPMEHGHLPGDVAALFLIAGVLAVLTPRGVTTGGRRSARDSETPRADVDPTPPGCAFLRYPNIPLGSEIPQQRRIRGLSRQRGFSCLWPKPSGVPTRQNISNVSSKRPKPMR